MGVHQKMNPALAVACVLLAAGTLHGAGRLNLRPDGSPELQGVAPEHVLTLELYSVPDAPGKRQAVLIYPTGRYRHHSDSSGHARWLPLLLPGAINYMKGQ
jgi:hypothetical protein